MRSTYDNALWFRCGPSYDTNSILGFTASNNMEINEQEIEKMQNKAAATYFEVFSEYFLGRIR